MGSDQMWYLEIIFLIITVVFEKMIIFRNNSIFLSGMSNVKCLGELLLEILFRI